MVLILILAFPLAHVIPLKVMAPLPAVTCTVLLFCEVISPWFSAKSWVVTLISYSVLWVKPVKVWLAPPV